MRTKRKKTTTVGHESGPADVFNIALSAAALDHHQPKLFTLDPAHSSDHSPPKELLADEYSENENFRILSIKVMLEEEDQASLGACKGT
ncbi:hypothetical protein PtB15_7B225 [Puccinia triticina]|nr:hypothetical protein PtB15_7B225 [Puccinia triticina]